jgi:hypothetical protein
VTTPEDFGNFSHTHRGARVTRVGLLDCVHGQCANCASQGENLGRLLTLMIRESSLLKGEIIR